MSIARPNIILRCDYCKNALYHSVTPEVDTARDIAYGHGWTYQQDKDSCGYCTIALVRSQRDSQQLDESGLANDRRQ